MSVMAVVVVEIPVRADDAELYEDDDVTEDENDGIDIVVDDAVCNAVT